LIQLKATLAEQMRVKRDEALARRYEIFGDRYGGDHATRLEEDEAVKQEEAELTDQTDTDEESDVESELDMEERAVLESQRQVCTTLSPNSVMPTLSQSPQTFMVCVCDMSADSTRVLSQTELH